MMCTKQCLLTGQDQIRLLDHKESSEKLSWATGAIFAVTLTGSAPIRKDMNAESG